MATLFKTQAGRIINLDHVTLIEDNHAYFSGQLIDEAVEISVRDIVNIEDNYTSDDPPDTETVNQLSSICDHLESMSESLYLMMESLKTMSKPNEGAK